MLNWVFEFNAKKHARKARLPSEQAGAESGPSQHGVKKTVETSANSDIQPELLHYFAQAPVSGGGEESPSNTTPMASPVAAEAVRNGDGTARREDRDAVAASAGLDCLVQARLEPVRALVVQAIKSVPDIPKPIVSLLAWEIGGIASIPVERHSDLLTSPGVAEAYEKISQQAERRVRPRVEARPARLAGRAAAAEFREAESGALTPDEWMAHAHAMRGNDLFAVSRAVGQILLSLLAERRHVDESLTREIFAEFEKRLRHSMREVT